MRRNIAAAMLEPVEACCLSTSDLMHVLRDSESESHPPRQLFCPLPGLCSVRSDTDELLGCQRSIA